jgi:hypothetical protein
VCVCACAGACVGGGLRDDPLDKHGYLRGSPLDKKGGPRVNALDKKGV